MWVVAFQRKATIGLGSCISLICYNPTEGGKATTTLPYSSREKTAVSAEANRLGINQSTVSQYIKSGKVFGEQQSVCVPKLFLIFSFAKRYCRSVVFYLLFFRLKFRYFIYCDNPLKVYWRV